MKISIYVLSIAAMVGLVSCGGGEEVKPVDPPSVAKKAEPVDPEADAMNNKGVGPVESIELGELDNALVESGKATFEAKCTACHKIDQKYIGPALAGVTERRTPEWVMNMILNPTEMIAKDPLAKKLVGDSNGAIMADQSLTQDEARGVLEYFRTINE